MEQRFFGRQSSSLNSVWLVNDGRRLLLARSDVIGGGLRRLQQTTSPADSNPAPRSPGQGSGSFRALDPNVVIIMVVLFFALICAALVNSLMRCLMRRRARAANARAVFIDRGGGLPDDNSEQGLDANTLASLPVLTFKSAEDSKPAEVDCTICLSEFTENERLRLLPKCSHVFHLDCIDMWLLSHTSCPVCRDGIKVDELALKVDHDIDSGEMMILTLDQDGNPLVRRNTGSAAGGAAGGATESGESAVNVRAELKRDKSYDRLSEAARLSRSRSERSTSQCNLGSSFRDGSMSARLGSSRSSLRSSLAAILTSGGDKNSSGRWLGSSWSVQATAAGPAPPARSSTTERPEGTTGGSLVASEQVLTSNPTL